jgi:predicted RNA-binding Zn ribbon-like protein
MTTKHSTPVMLTCQGILMVTQELQSLPVSELPSWYPGSENKLAPMPLLRVQAFVNTLDLEERTDLLADPGTAREWLTDAGVIEQCFELRDSDLALAREVREAIRALLEGHTGDDLEPLRRVAESRAARLTVAEDGVLGLDTAGVGGLDDGLFAMLLIVRGAQEDGTWSRLKICANPDCRWAFFDRSRNQQGNWCDMAVCGNRLKNRQLRARRR